MMEKEDVAKKKKLFFGGISFFANSIKFSYKNLQRLLNMLPDSVPKSGMNISEEWFWEVSSHAWLIIDNTYRFIGLINSTPGIKNDCYKKAFIEDTYIIKNFRHYIQHVNKEFKNIMNRKKSILGQVSCAKPKKDHAIIYSIISDTILIDNNDILLKKPSGTIVGPIDFITLCVSDLEINLSDIHRSVDKYYSILQKKYSLEEGTASRIVVSGKLS